MTGTPTPTELTDDESLATAPRTSEPTAGEPTASAVGLSAPQGRIVGSLIEKQLVTPQQYPLTLNALVLACNQASNRDPVVAYTEEQVVGALDELKERRLVRFVLPSHGRSVVRYRHVLDEAFGVDAPQLAILAMLLLRGPQTVGELRTRHRPDGQLRRTRGGRARAGVAGRLGAAAGRPAGPPAGAEGGTLGRTPPGAGPLGRCPAGARLRR